MFNKSNLHSVYISIRCDNKFSQYSDIYPGFEKLRKELSQIAGVKVGDVNHHTYNNSRYMETIDTYYCKVSYPKEVYETVSNLIGKQIMVLISAEKPSTNPCSGPRYTY